MQLSCESESDDADAINVQSWSSINRDQESSSAVSNEESFIGYSGVKVISNSSDNITDIVNLFFYLYS